MCGIAGWIDWEVDLTSQQTVLEKMTDRLTPRGPDAVGFWLSSRAALGHRRLIVVDPEGGKQPMVCCYGDRTYVLVYNGELYNTEDIRRELLQKGHTFRSYSDTEVLLVAFVEWGVECLGHFNGIYAFAVWDESEQSLFLARDRMGVKPLFYAVRGDSLIFGSEIKAILAHPKVEPILDGQGLSEIFGLGPARTPGIGVFKDVFEIRPGQWGLYNRNGLRIGRYWELHSLPHYDSLDDTVKRVQDLVEDTIKRQLVSDVPVCTFLSGGLDSSIITAVTSRFYQETGRGKLRTFSVDYIGNDTYFKPSDFQPNSDATWIEKVVRYLDTEHEGVYIDTPQLAEALRDAVIARDLPGMVDVDSSLWLFCKAVKNKATVALSGECADEVFGGYPWFYREDALNSGTFPWAPSLMVRKQILSAELNERLDLDEYVNRRYRESLSEVPQLEGEPLEAVRRRELFYLNLNWFMAVLLDRKDRMSMASGLEVRVPYCDHRLVEYVWNIPWEYKTCDGREKGVLRRAMRGLLPDDVIFRKKSPYPKTHDPGYTQLVKNELVRILNEPDTPLRELLDVDGIRKLICSENSQLDRPWFGQLMAGPQLMAYLIQLDIWLRNYKVQVKI